MKRLAILLFLVTAMAQSSFESGNSCSTPLQVKAKYLSIRINKYETEKIELLISELLGYEDKVVSANFYPSSHTLTVYYTNLLTIDNICEVVQKYFTEYEKVGGTDL